MAIATFSVPIDIPWRRIAFSEDMMDKVACDRELPLRWRSSVAVFDYEPPKEQQRQDGFKVSYLKVACTITGYQPNDREIRIRERLGKSGWTRKNRNEELQTAVGAYYACYGAMLEVVVAPHPEDRFTLREYPYFADFDPKKRELYEVVTETGEVMSRSLEDVNVRQGQTSLQSHEVRDSTSLAGEIAGAYGSAYSGGQISGKGAIANESGTTDITQQATENVRTTDAAREARETLSHTSQLSQMYHLLNSYHLGTNRAAFFVLPRPHVKQSPNTFVNGPREIEGVQEFMLVVVRPEAMESFCVEAYLETAHLTHDPEYDMGETIRPLPLKVNAEIHENDDHSYQNTVTGTNSSPTIAGKVVDTGQGVHGGYEYTAIAYGPFPPSISFNVASDHVQVTASVTANWDEPQEVLAPASLDLNATVYYKNAVPTISGYTDGLLITARAVCSCTLPERTHLVGYEKGLSIVYEKQIGKTSVREGRERAPMPILEANRLQADIHREMMQSLSSADRYPRGTVGLLDTQMIAGRIGASLRNADTETDKRLADWPGIHEDLARRGARYAPSMTRSKLLEMPLARQVETFGLTFAEAVALRRSLADIEVPDSPPPRPQRRTVGVPLLTGLTLREAHPLLAGVGLRVGSVITVDSPLPAGVVVRHTPGGDDDAELGAAIAMEIASGLSVRLPEVTGLGLTQAACRLREAGLRNEPTVEGRSGPEARVAGLEPRAGTLVTPNAAITIRLEHRPQR